MIISPKDFYEKLSYGSEKRVALQCDDCGFKYDTIYYNYIKTQQKQKRNGETYCKACSAIRTGIKKRGIPSPMKGKRFPERSRENSSSWKGGSYINNEGYKMIHIKPKENNTGWNSYRKEHIVLMEKEINRKIKKGEAVHHIDGDKLNNDISNLILLNNKQHRESHASLQKIGYKLIKAGFIKYDRDKKEYYFSEELSEFIK